MSDRGDFENWYINTRLPDLGIYGDDIDEEIAKNDKGEYVYSGADDCYAGWQGRQSEINRLQNENDRLAYELWKVNQMLAEKNHER